ncbi:MAG: protein kinase [Pyrinomonadaceae bacterium]|nr:protein kinase [Pyrinomonadaceae bacterium]
MKKCPKCGNEYETTNTLCPLDGTVLEKTGADELIGQTLAGKYRIDDHISNGGMGAVYRATHVLMEKSVAIKVLHPALAADDKIVQRFTREAKAASRISHPHALNVTDFGEAENGVVFLVMEYLRGRTLKEVIREEGVLPLSRAVEIIRQVCGALDAAHAEGVVHRDLKSDNIMLEELDAGDWAKVLDFGIAKIQEPVGQDPALTAPNLVIGTPQYMSPEQCSQSPDIDRRSDIYSLGIILFEMLTGHVPFTADSPTEIMMKQLQDAPPSLMEEREDLPIEVSRIITRALAKRPEDRFQSAGEFSEALTLAAEAPASTVNDASVASSVAAPISEVSGEQEAGRETKRIVVPTGVNESPPDTSNTQHDEATILHPSQSAFAEPDAQFVNRHAAPPPPSVSNGIPLRLAVPVVALLALTAIMAYTLTRDSGAQPATNGVMNAPLASDPNSQPVQPTAPATGESERNIAPSSNAGASTMTGGSSSGTVNRSEGQGASGLPPLININDNSSNSNAEQGNDNTAAENSNAESTPSSTSNRNTNQRRNTPAPQVSPTPDADPGEPSATPPRRRQPPSDNAPPPPATAVPSPDAP